MSGNAMAGDRVRLHLRFLGFDVKVDEISDYMRRWMFRTPWGGLRLHHILRGDGDRHPHDHPFGFASLILSGGYVEHAPLDAEARCWGSRRFCAGDLNVKRAEDLHRLELPDGPVWTLVLSGPHRRRWGFRTEDGWVDAGEYDGWKARRARAPEVE